MNQKKPMAGLFLSVVAFAAFFTVSKADAGIVKIINRSDDNIKVYVIPGVEGVPYCWKCFGSCLTCEKSSAEIVVPLKAFCDCAHFSVVEISNGILGSGKCKNLSVFKNYEVSFSETTLGTACITKEIL